MIDTAVDLAVFLVTAHNITLQTVRKGLEYHMSLLHLLHLATS